MLIIPEINNLLNFNFLNWKDLLEIIFFSTIFYYLSILFKKKLLMYFYIYCIIAFIAYTLQLEAIIHFISIYTPAIFIIFILINQNKIKDIFLKKQKSINTKNFNWIEILIRSCLNSMNKSKELLFIIEKNNSLDELMEKPFKFDSNLQNNLLETLTTVKDFDPQKFILINQHGKLIAINAIWKKTTFKKYSWEKNSIQITSETDALILKSCAITRSFIIIINGKIIENINISNIIKIIQRFILKKNLEK